MRISVKRLRALLGLFGVVHLATVAHAQDASTEPTSPSLVAEATDELDRWVPSLSVSLELLMHDVSGGIEPTPLLGPFDHSEENPDRVAGLSVLRPDSSGSNLVMTPVSSLSAEFMTPGLRSIPFLPEIEVPGAPRLFVHGEVSPSYSLTYRIAKEGDPKPPTVPSNITANNRDLREGVVFGQGSLLETEAKRWMFAAGAGIAFTVDVFDRRFRVKPSFEWFTEELKVRGELRRAVSLIPKPKRPHDFRFEHLTGSKTKRFHALGAGVEFELDTKRAGPFLVSVFGNARGYRFQGSGKIEIRDSNVHGEEVVYSIKRDRYAYRAATGIRVRLAVE